MTSNLDKKKFITLIQDNQAIIHKVCTVYCRNDEDRKDLTQEIIYNLWKSYGGFSGKAKFSTWMYRVALNTALMDLRKAQSRPQYIPGDMGNLDALDASIGEHESDEVEALFVAIRQLPPLDKSIIMLYLERKSYAEIADITGLTEKNISVRLSRIRTKLRELMKEGGERT